MAKVERDPKVRNDDSLKGPTAAHRGRWLLETIGNLVRRIESPSSNEGERERAIGDINRTWLALASPYTADKLLREVLIQALQHAASPEVGIVRRWRHTSPRSILRTRERDSSRTSKERTPTMLRGSLANPRESTDRSRHSHAASGTR